MKFGLSFNDPVPGETVVALVVVDVELVVFGVVSVVVGSH